jgi:hypothetical protein
MRGVSGDDGLVYDPVTTISHVQALSSLLRRIFIAVEVGKRAKGQDVVTRDAMPGDVQRCNL